MLFRSIPEAIVQSGSESTVFVAVGDRAQRRVVKTGIADDQGVEIREGLKAGELVITRGQGEVADGTLISVDLRP